MEKTTNISELPIKSNIPPVESSEMENKIQPSTQQFAIDQGVVHTQPEKNRHVFRRRVGENIVC